MDNVTHSLAGLVLAEAAVRLRARRTGQEPPARLRTVAAVCSVAAANLPDLDLLYSGTGANRLAYMLHHRGHTHTVVVAALGAALLWGAALLVLRMRGAVPRPDARWLLGLVGVSTASHLLLDWTNSYGVHPFWPFDNRWKYGDAVFIVEPWFWAVAVPMLVAATARRTLRVFLSLILLAGLALAWSVSLVAPGAAAALTLGAAASVVLARVLRPDGRAAAAVAGWIAVTLAMAVGTAVARETARRSVRAADPAARVLDLVTTPLPANPVCVAVIAVERSGAAYRVATARVSAAPALVEAARCPTRGGGSLLRPSARPSTPAIQWDGEWTAPHAELAALARESCTARAALRFIRVPVWRDAGASSVRLGDARYGGGSGDGFSDLTVERRPRSCPEGVPPWVPPRADLIGYDDR
jgi:inner membrane protein